MLLLLLLLLLSSNVADLLLLLLLLLCWLLPHVAAMLPATLLWLLLLLKVRTHQKVLNKYLYIPHFSFHPPSVFRSFINAELIRYVVTNSDEYWFDCMVRKFVHRLRQRGYPQRLLASITSRVSFSQRHQYLSASSNSKKALAASSKSVMVVPYAQLMPELQLQKLLRDAYVIGGEGLHTWVPERPIIAYTKSRNLGSFLVKASH
jgi:hypothetical protein